MSSDKSRFPPGMTFGNMFNWNEEERSAFFKITDSPKYTNPTYNPCRVTTGDQLDAYKLFLGAQVSRRFIPSDYRLIDHPTIARVFKLFGTMNTPYRRVLEEISLSENVHKCLISMCTFWWPMNKFGQGREIREFIAMPNIVICMEKITPERYNSGRIKEWTFEQVYSFMCSSGSIQKHITIDQTVHIPKPRVGKPPKDNRKFVKDDIDMKYCEYRDGDPKLMRLESTLGTISNVINHFLSLYLRENPQFKCKFLSELTFQDDFNNLNKALIAYHQSPTPMVKQVDAMILPSAPPSEAVLKQPQPSIPEKLPVENINPPQQKTTMPYIICDIPFPDDVLINSDLFRSSILDILNCLECRKINVGIYNGTNILTMCFGTTKDNVNITDASIAIAIKPQIPQGNAVLFCPKNDVDFNHITEYLMAICKSSIKVLASIGDDASDEKIEFLDSCLKENKYSKETINIDLNPHFISFVHVTWPKMN